MGKGRKVVEEFLRNRDISPEKDYTRPPSYAMPRGDDGDDDVDDGDGNNPVLFPKMWCTMYVETTVPVSQ
jgi:hypothetical protein